MADRVNPFLADFRVEICSGGGYVLTVFSKARGESPVTWAFTTVGDLVAFLSAASSALPGQVQSSFDFRDHLKKEPAHGTSS